MSDKKYIKNGVVNNGNMLVTEEGTIFNPTPEMFYERGWQDFIEPNIESQQTLEQVRAQVISELLSFENGTVVRGAYINDELTWIPASDRVNYMVGLTALKKQGETEVVWDGKKVAIDTLLAGLDVLNAHEARATLQTRAHLKKIKELKTEAELLGYDYTEGYPDIPDIQF